MAGVPTRAGTKRPPEQGSAAPGPVAPKQKKRSEPPSEQRQTRSAVLTVALDPPPLEAFPLVATQPRGLAKDFDAVDEKERPSKGPTARQQSATVAAATAAVTDKWHYGHHEAPSRPVPF